MILNLNLCMKKHAQRGQICSSGPQNIMAEVRNWALFCCERDVYLGLQVTHTMKNKITKRFQILDHRFGPQSQTLRGSCSLAYEVRHSRRKWGKQQLEVFFTFQKDPVMTRKNWPPESSRVWAVCWELTFIQPIVLAPILNYQNCSVGQQIIMKHQLGASEYSGSGRTDAEAEALVLTTWCGELIY